MAKQKKKRNKAYTGIGSTTTHPSVTRISAVNRSKLGQWWFDNKRIIKPLLIAAAVIVFIIVVVIEIIRIVTGG